jgi:hypothetical protein
MKTKSAFHAGFKTNNLKFQKMAENSKTACLTIQTGCIAFGFWPAGISEIC